MSESPSGYREDGALDYFLMVVCAILLPVLIAGAFCL